MQFGSDLWVSFSPSHMAKAEKQEGKHEYFSSLSMTLPSHDRPKQVIWPESDCFRPCSFVITLYLLWLCWIFTAACGLSLFVGNAGYSSFAATGLSSWWLLLVQSWGPRCMGPVAVVCSFSCSKACGILDPGPGIETVFFALAGRFLTSGRPGRSSDSLL